MTEATDYMEISKISTIYMPAHLVYPLNGSTEFLPIKFRFKHDDKTKLISLTADLTNENLKLNLTADAGSITEDEMKAHLSHCCDKVEFIQTRPQVKHYFDEVRQSILDQLSEIASYRDIGGVVNLPKVLGRITKPKEGIMCAFDKANITISNNTDNDKPLIKIAVPVALPISGSHDYIAKAMKEAKDTLSFVATTDDKKSYTATKCTLESVEINGTTMKLSFNTCNIKEKNITREPEIPVIPIAEAACQEDRMQMIVAEQSTKQCLLDYRRILRVKDTQQKQDTQRVQDRFTRIIER